MASLTPTSAQLSSTNRTSLDGEIHTEEQDAEQDGRSSSRITRGPLATRERGSGDGGGGGT